jgi:galactose mutarotase-like enzyme
MALYILPQQYYFIPKLNISRFALALEAQMLPDSVHHQGDIAWAPSPVLRAGDEYRQRTGYRFFKEANR